MSTATKTATQAVSSAGASSAATAPGVHWAVRLNHRNRSATFLLFLATLVSHLPSQTVPVWVWGLALLHFVAYPRLAYEVVRRRPAGLSAATNNLRLDALLFGVWIPLLGFPLWISFAFFLAATINLVVYVGAAGFYQACAGLALGVAVGLQAVGLHWMPLTEPLPTALSMVTITLFLLLMSTGAHSRTVRLTEARMHLINNDRALRVQLAQNQELQNQLREKANRDGLTGLYNRHYLDSTLTREVARCRREDKPISVLMIDIDHFKMVNDTYGHAAGDAVLRRLAGLIMQRSRAADIPCRYGGEEFLLLLPNANREQARLCAEGLRSAFEDSEVLHGEQRIHATVSIGVSEFDTNIDDAVNFVGFADLALYEAKRSGRNRVIVSSHGDNGVPAGGAPPVLPGATAEPG